ncbi:TssQ family T6SS-associated lipoprotein [Undibacterium sp. WLHG33]|uniref:TssQ family T6SS-associated lipoprotein n=1 Tax=Undibacterium sp. WLHG33 TaxID=3412482 RepID=UPI003C2E768C
MKNILRLSPVCSLLLICVFLQGCETATKNVPAPKVAVKSKETKPVAAANAAPEAATSAPAISADVQAYNEGNALYNDGNYNGAIRKLSGATEIWTGNNKALQLNALKTMAFSYCVTSRTQLCRQQFERALKLDPGFDLMPNEIGHPIWGPVFQKAKKAKSVKK